jgi:hypothetical protein
MTGTDASTDASRSLAMNATSTAYELRFQSLFHEGRGLAFPCDAAGSVNLDALPERARRNYDFARTLIGRDYAAPAVMPTYAAVVLH